MAFDIRNTRRFTHFAAVLIVAGLALSSCEGKRAQLHIGQTLEECTALYGSGTMENYFAPHSKTIQYTKPSDTVQVIFYDDRDTGVYYHIGDVDLEDKKIKDYLDLNSQGLHWTLQGASRTGNTHAEWVRSDGATASYYGGGGTSGTLTVNSPKSK